MPTVPNIILADSPTLLFKRSIPELLTSLTGFVQLLAQHFHKIAPHYRAGLEALLPGIGRFVPVGEGHAAGRVIGKLPDGVYQRLKISLISG
jgi:hypothetical protein